MGILRQIKDYERKALCLADQEYRGLNWCELGNQIDIDRKEPAKKGYLVRGAHHTSIDLNGKNDALALDLDKPLPTRLLDSFDVITNYGTIEHINNQFQVFKSVHDLCKKGGIIIHGLTLKDNWPDHCRYYYTEEMMKKLSALCNYEILDMTILNSGYFKHPKNLLMITYRKQDTNSFIDKESFKRIGIIDSGNKNNTGNYTNLFSKIIRKIVGIIK